MSFHILFSGIITSTSEYMKGFRLCNSLTVFFAVSQGAQLMRVKRVNRTFWRRNLVGCIASRWGENSRVPAFQRRFWRGNHDVTLFGSWCWRRGRFWSSGRLLVVQKVLSSLERLGDDVDM